MTLEKYQLSDFVLQKQIGSGGYSRVFCALERRNFRLVALKVFPNTPDSQKQYLKEKHVAFLLFANNNNNKKSPQPEEQKEDEEEEENYLGRVFGYIEEGEKKVLVLEYYGGGDLFSKLRQIRKQKNGDLSGAEEIFSSSSFPSGGRIASPSEEEEYRLLAAQVVVGLQSLHQSGVVWVDLKPENLLLSSDTSLRLVDFGAVFFLNEKKNNETKTEIQIEDQDNDNDNDIDKEKEKLLFDDENQTEEEVEEELVYTEEYAAPELVERRREEISAATDVWAFGVLLYEMFFGVSPFAASEDRPSDICEAKFSFPQRSRTKGLSEFEEVKDLVRRILVVRPEERLTLHEVQQHSWFHGFNWKNLTMINGG